MDSICYFFIENPLSLQEMSAKEIGEQLLSMLKQLIPKEPISEIDKMEVKIKIDQFAKYICELPVPLHEDIFDGIVSALYNYYISTQLLNLNCSLSANSNNKLAEEILPIITEAISHLKIQVFSDRKPHFGYFKFIYPYLPNMCYLKCLDITKFNFDMEYSDYEDLILKAVNNMKNLEQLTLSYYYTDKVIEAIQLNCKKLIFMDLKETEAKELTDSCIQYLIYLKSLKYLHIGDYNLSIEAYVQLFIQRPTLNIQLNSSIMRIILTRLRKHWSQSMYSTNLHVDVYSTDDIQNISIVFSQLKSLKITCNNRETNFESLSLLTQLESICIEFTDFNNIKLLLEKLGKSLKKLELISIGNVNVVEIADYCLNLRELTLNRCKYNSIENLENCANKYDVFNYLKKLVCLFNISEGSLKFLLSNCKNISHLKIGMVDNIINDECLFNVLDCTQLKTLYLGPNNMFSKRVLSFILSNMNFKKLIGLQQCYLLNKNEAEELMSLHPNVRFEMFE